MIIFALMLAAPTAFTETHQRDIACVVEVAVLADAQRRNAASGSDVQLLGKRWAGMVGARITQESGQPRELVAFAMTEAAKARQTATNALLGSCIAQMNAELAGADAANAPLPKPQRAQ